MTQPFELEAVGGPWGRRLAGRRGDIDAFPWSQRIESSAEARWVWTQSSFSEYASAAAFAEIATALLAAGAPIDLIAAAGDFVVDEMIHAELSGRVAMALGGAVPLAVDLQRLVRPATGEDALRRAAELIVRTSCVGEALTVPILKTTLHTASCPLIRAVVNRIVADESAHAELGGWFLDWADDKLSDEDRLHLGRVASEAVVAFAPLMRAGSACETPAHARASGVLACDNYDRAFQHALATRVVAPLALRGVVVNVC